MPNTDQSIDYYRAARALLPEMDNEMRQKIEALLHQAEQGVNTDNLIVDIITESDELRRRLREITGKDLERTIGAYTPIGGDPGPIPAQKFVCPVKGHDYSRRISRAGEDPGICPKHKVPLILASEEKRGT